MPVFLVYFALLAVAFFFLIVRPQRRQLAARRALIQAVEVGDEIITAGGIYGEITAVDEDDVRVRIAPELEVRVARRAIAGVTTSHDAEELEKPEEPERPEPTPGT